MPPRRQHLLGSKTFSPCQFRLRLLEDVNLADFVPGVETYEVATKVELFPAPEGVRMASGLTGCMMISELDKLAARIARRQPRALP